MEEKRSESPELRYKMKMTAKTPSNNRINKIRMSKSIKIIIQKLKKLYKKQGYKKQGHKQDTITKLKDTNCLDIFNNF
jgi:hypothetical protein